MFHVNAQKQKNLNPKRKETFIMTGNQIAYAGLQENIRHNQVTEGETHRHNVTSEQEVLRSNIARETETRRHNVETEAQGWFGQRENQRHNLATEQQNAQMLQETIRHNWSTEGINRMQAQASLSQAQSSALQAQAAWKNAGTKYLEWGTGEKRYSMDYERSQHENRYTDTKRITSIIDSASNWVSSWMRPITTILGGN